MGIMGSFLVSNFSLDVVNGTPKRLSAVGLWALGLVYTIGVDLKPEA
jgi:hypothetical protein